MLWLFRICHYGKYLGRCIATGAEASALRSLAPGFYIVNGQKLLVK